MLHGMMEAVLYVALAAAVGVLVYNVVVAMREKRRDDSGSDTRSNTPS